MKKNLCIMYFKIHAKSFANINMYAVIKKHFLLNT